MARLVVGLLRALGGGIRLQYVTPSGCRRWGAGEGGESRPRREPTEPAASRAARAEPAASRAGREPII